MSQRERVSGEGPQSHLNTVPAALGPRSGPRGSDAAFQACGRDSVPGACGSPAERRALYSSPRFVNGCCSVHLSVYTNFSEILEPPVQPPNQQAQWRDPRPEQLLAAGTAPVTPGYRRDSVLRWAGPNGTKARIRRRGWSEQEKQGGCRPLDQFWLLTGCAMNACLQDNITSTASISQARYRPAALALPSSGGRQALSRLWLGAGMEAERTNAIPGALPPGK